MCDMKHGTRSHGRSLALVGRVALLGALLCLASCGSVKAREPEVTPAWAQHAPESIEVRISRDEGIELEAAKLVRGEIETRLARRGYRVEPVADARLEVAIVDWGRQLRISRGSASQSVGLEAFLHDMASSEVLWRGSARATDEDDDEESDNDWISAMLDWLADEVVSWFTDETEDVVEDAVRELLSSLPARELAAAQTAPN